MPIAAPAFLGCKNLEFVMNKFACFVPVARRLAVSGAALAAAAGAHAATGAAIDVTDVVSTIGAQLVPIGLVGTAVLGVIVAVRAFKWVRSATS